MTMHLCPRHLSPFTFFFFAQKWPMTTNISSIGSSHLSSFRLPPYIQSFSTTISSFFAPNFSVLHISFSFEIMLNKFSRHSSFWWMSGNLFTNDCIYSITISISGIYMFSINDSSCLNINIIVVGTDCHSSFSHECMMWWICLMLKGIWGPTWNSSYWKCINLETQLQINKMSKMG